MARKKRGWFGNMLTGTNGGYSSKRIFGGFGLTIMHIIAIFSVIFYPDSSWIGEVLITLTVTDAGLLGVGVLEREKESVIRRRMMEEKRKEKEKEEDEELYEEG